MSATTPRYEVIPSRHWKNSRTGQTASLYGAVPYVNDAEAEGWSLVTKGFTVRDNVRGTVGFGRRPFDTEKEAETFVAGLLTLHARASASRP